MTERRIRKASADWAQPKKQAPRPKGLAHGRWLGDFGDLSAAETELLTRTAEGEDCIIADTRPAEADQSDQNSIRGELIRFLMLGGDSEHPVHEKGVRVCGGWITGQFDLEEITSPFPLLLVECHFGAALILINAKLSGLYLDASMLPELNAQGLTASGNVSLKNAITLGEVRLSGAVIAGQLSCEGACFENCDGDGAAIGHALNAQGILVKGGVFLRGITTLGEVSLSGAVIDGQLACTDTIFSNCDADGTAIGDALNAHSMTVKGGVFLRGMTTLGEVRLSGAVIEGYLDCADAILSNCDADATAIGNALHAQDITVNAGLFFKPAACTGSVHFTNANVTALDDDLKAWPKGQYSLNGFRYKHMFGDLPAPARIKWLEGQVPSQLNKDFAPQPWEQLITIYREMGHSGEAAEVAMAKQDAMRRAGKIKGKLGKTLHWLYGAAAGYGYRPLWLLGWMMGLCLTSALYFGFGAADGLIGPTDPLLTSPDSAPHIAATCGHAGEYAKQFWTDCKAMPPEYSVFNPLIYSIDAILPLVDLQQEVDWSPIVNDEQGNPLPFGIFLRWLMWFEILFGWTASLMFVAIVSRLVEKD